MRNPNRGCSEETLERLKASSYERFRIELIKSIEKLLTDFNMTWDDLAEKLKWKLPPIDVEHAGFYLDGKEIKKEIGRKQLKINELNDIAHCFSAELYLIFKPRFPYIIS